MKLKFQCRKCFREYVKTVDPVQIQDDNLYEFTCSENHRNIYFVNNEKFELLMQSAIYAILDGYYREAVSAMTASLERLQEFAIIVIIKKNNFSNDQFKIAWSTISKQSERQLGAFTFLYLREFGKLPELLTDKERGFRNNVIHNGTFPTYDETLKYGQRILDISFSVLSEIRDKAENVIRDHAKEESENKLSMIEARGENPFTFQLSNIINLHWHLSNFKKTDLKEYLKQITDPNFQHGI